MFLPSEQCIFERFTVWAMSTYQSCIADWQEIIEYVFCNLNQMMNVCIKYIFLIELHTS